MNDDRNKNLNAENKIINSLLSVLGGDINIKIVYVDKFPQTPSGKFRWVVSEKFQSIN